MKKNILLLSLVFLLSNCSSSNETSSDNSNDTNNSSANWVSIPFSGDKGFGIQSSCTNGQDLFIGTVSQGIFKSIDGGKNWIEINNGIVYKQECKVYYLNNALYATTSLLSPGLPTRTKTYKSTDNGNTWIPVWKSLYSYYYENVGSNYQFTYDDGIPNKIGTISIIDSNIFVTIGSYVFKSINSGIDWKLVKTLDLNDSGKQFLKFNSSIFLRSNYFGSNVNGKIYKSLDGGNNFNSINNDLNNQSIISAMAFSNNNIFLGTGRLDSNDFGKIYRTDENATNWQLSNKGIKDSPLTSITCLYSIDNNIFAGRNNEIFKSKDKGSSWELLGDKVEGTCLDFLKIGNFIYVVTNTKIYKINY